MGTGPHGIMDDVFRYMSGRAGHAQNIRDVAKTLGIEHGYVSTALGRLARKGSGIHPCPEIGRGWWVYRPPAPAEPDAAPGPPPPAEDTFSPDTTMFEYLGRTKGGIMLVRQPESSTIWKLEAF